jgi:hypothetical protein
MPFLTKIDFSNNRQVKQNIETFTTLSGGTVFGVPYSYLPTGPDSNTSGITQTLSNVTSTFTGTSATTVYNWYNSNMNLGSPYLSALTPSNSATTQNTGFIFTSNTQTTIDGNLVTLTYSGVSFNVTVIDFVTLSPGVYSGNVNTNTLNYLSAGTLDFTGRTIWVDVSGITRTNKLIISDVGAGPSIVDIGVDSSGNVVNVASDISLKEEISPINSALSLVNRLNGVYYKWKNRESGGETRKIGFIAQEVEEIIPELVYTHKDGLKTVHYKDVTALLVEAIKEISYGVTSGTTYLQTQSIVAEDNNIDLNFNGNKESSIGGGIRVLNAINGNSADFTIDETGDWVTNNNIKPSGIIIPTLTPKSSSDVVGVNGNIVKDDDFLYIKTNNKWKRIKLEEF